jgi:hypothetical protein
MTRILGLDICANRAVCWLLTDGIPRDPKTYWRDKCKSDERSKDPDKDPFTFYFNSSGIAGLLSLKPDVIALEPTGVHYSKLIENVCKAEGIKILWVGHLQSSHHRKSYKLPDKNDLADAFAIACYAATFINQPHYFLEFTPEVAEIRRLYLQLKSITRYRNPLIARIIQQLTHEFPEALQPKKNIKVTNPITGEVESKPSTNRKYKYKFTILDDGRRALIVWLAERERDITRKTYYWDDLYKKSISHRYGGGISTFTKKLAIFTDEFDLLDFELTQELAALVLNPRFKVYNKVFDEFNFGLMLRAILLALIYPFEHRFESIGQFKKRIGLGLDENSSGNNQSFSSKTGSIACQSEFYLWASTTIAINKNRPDSLIGEKICTFYDDWIKKFSENPDDWEKYLEVKAKLKAIANLKRHFDKSKFSKDSVKLIDAELDRMTTAILNESVKTKKTDRNRKFSNLALCKTASYTGRWLYRRLKAELIDK